MQAIIFADVSGIVSTLLKRKSTGKPLSLSKNLQVENKTSQVTINLNLLSYEAKQISQTAQSRKFRLKESPTQQVV